VQPVTSRQSVLMHELYDNTTIEGQILSFNADDTSDFGNDLFLLMLVLMRIPNRRGFFIFLSEFGPALILFLTWIKAFLECTFRDTSGSSVIKSENYIEITVCKT